MKSAEALPTSNIKSNDQKKRTSAETAAGPNRCIEVDTETVDFNASLLPRPSLHDDAPGSPSSLPAAGTGMKNLGAVARLPAATPLRGDGGPTKPSDGVFFLDGGSSELPSFHGSQNQLSALPLTQTQMTPQNPLSIANRTSRSLPKPTRNPDCNWN